MAISALVARTAFSVVGSAADGCKSLVDAAMVMMVVVGASLLVIGSIADVVGSSDGADTSLLDVDCMENVDGSADMLVTGLPS